MKKSFAALLLGVFVFGVLFTQVSIDATDAGPGPLRLIATDAGPGPLAPRV